MSMLLSRLIANLWVKAARRPYVAAAVASVVAFGVSVIWWFGGASMSERGAPVLPFIAFLIAATLLGAGWYVTGVNNQRLAAARHSLIVPPPPFVTKPNFWFGFAMALVMLPIAAAFVPSLQVEDGRTVAESTIVAAEYAPNEFGKPFYEVLVEFTTADGIVTEGITSQYGSATVGESVTIQYLDAQPSDILKYDRANQLGLIAMFGGMGVLGMATAVVNRPRRVLRDMPATAVHGSGQWSQRTNNGESGLMQEHHFFAGTTSTIWVWKTGERTAQGLADWIESGGTPQPGTYTHWNFETAEVAEIALAKGTLSIIAAPGETAKAKHFRVPNGGMELLTAIATVPGWELVQAVGAPEPGRLSRLFGAKKSTEPALTVRPAGIKSQPASSISG